MNKQELIDRICEVLPQDEKILSPAELIGSILDAVPLLCTKLKDNLFVGTEPESPVDATTLYDTGGPNSQDAFNAIDTVGVQVRVRSKSYRSGWQLISEIKTSLQSIPGVEFNKQCIVGLWVESPPMLIGKDGQSNSLFTMNLRLMVTSEHTGHRA